MKTPLIKRLENHARNNPFWISGGKYEELAMKAGYKASNCSRRLRELCVAGILERREVGGHVEYRYIFTHEEEDHEEYQAEMEREVRRLNEIAREEKQKVEVGVQRALV